jgi:hypothetical protein
MLDTNVKQEKILCGLDCGFGHYKISFDGDKNIKFISIVGEPVSDFSRAMAINSMSELIDSLAITYNGKKYYIGKNAILNTRNGRISLRTNRNDDEQTKIKIMTALALMTDQQQTYANVDIVVGLPVLEFKNGKEKLFTMLYNDSKPFEFTMHYGNQAIEKKIILSNISTIG